MSGQETIARCEKEIQDLRPQKLAIRDKMLALNAERDKAKATMDLEKLRANHPNLKIDLA